MQLGTYCLIDAHSRCPIPAQCTCHCHVAALHAPFLGKKKGGRGSRPNGRAQVHLDADGHRICPQCHGPLTKKNPHGPGRYPRLCDTCR